MMPNPFIKRLLVGSLLIGSAAVARQDLQAESFMASAQEESLTPYTHVSEVPQTAVDL